MTQLEMMPKAPDTRAANNPWPEWPKVCKTDYGQEEAIAVFGHDPRIYQTTVKEFLKDKNGNLNGIITVKLESKKDEKTGRMVMSEVPGSETKLDADLVLIAAGFLGTEKICCRCVWRRAECKDERVDGRGRICDKREKCICSRRCAQRTVSCRVGDP